MDGTDWQGAAAGEAYGQGAGGQVAPAEAEAGAHAEGPAASHAEVGDGARRGAEVGHPPTPDALAGDPHWQELAEFKTDAELLAAMSATYGQEATDALRRDWVGPDLRLNFLFAQKAADSFVSDALVAKLEAAGVWRSAELLRAAAAIGRMVSTSPGNPLGIPTPGEVMAVLQAPVKAAESRQKADRAALQGQIDRMMARYGSAEYSSPAFQQKLQALYAKAYPGEAA